MKILLLGDFSGFSVALKEGLVANGHSVDLVSKGDGFKKTSNADIKIPITKNKYIRRLQKIIFPFWGIRKLYGYDVVQLVTHNIFGGLAFSYNSYLINKIAKRSKAVFLSSCGDDYFLYLNKDSLRYNYIDESINIDLKGKNPFSKKSYISNNIKVVSTVDCIIPTAYTYAEAYRWSDKLSKTIPLPVNVQTIEFMEQLFKDGKITIFHGLNREGFKGTRHIIEAMNKIKEKYPDLVEIKINGKMPYSEYIKILRETNIVVDQAYAYDYGMNAIISMAMGKVVLSGNEIESMKEYNRFDNPIVNITPSVDSIYNQIEKLILNKENIVKLGLQGRAYVEDFHNYKKIAGEYVKIWQSKIEEKINQQN